MQNLSDEIEIIYLFIDTRWGWDTCVSHNKELTLYSCYQKNFNLHRRLLKFVELWWRKTQYNKISDIIISEIPDRGLRDAICNTVVSGMWERRCKEISEMQIHGELPRTKWFWCEQCHFFPHSISDNGDRFDEYMTAWG
jgi:hypothetical protein